MDEPHPSLTIDEIWYAEAVHRKLPDADFSASPRVGEGPLQVTFTDISSAGAAPTQPDCISVARWDDGAGGWISATPFPYCVPDAEQFLTGVAEQGN